MKKKSRHAQLKRRSEFRFHTIGFLHPKGKIHKMRHPAYVFLEKGNLYIYVSLTHSSNIEKLLLIKLRKNPNPKDNKDSYYVEEIKEDTKDSFGVILKDWEMDEEDDHQIRELFDNKIKR